MEITKCPLYSEFVEGICHNPRANAGHCKDVTNCILKDILDKDLDKHIRDNMLGIKK